MGEIYITLEEAAGLENVKYNTMIQRIKRNPKAFRTKTEPVSGGKDRVLIALSSLSKKARQAYKKAANIDGVDVVIEENVSTAEMPWYVGIDLAAYIEKNGKEYYEAVERAKIIREFLNYGDRDRTEFAVRFAESHGMSWRTLYRYAQSYLEASAWAMKMSKQDGGNYDFFKVLALCRKPKQKHTFPSLTPEVRAFIENLWFDRAFAENNGTREMLYSKLMKVGSANSWDIPSYPTVARYIDYLMNVKRGKNARLLAEKGLREFKNQRMVKASRNTRALPVMGLVQGDSHHFDLWVKYTYPNGKVRAIRPQLVAWVDTRSRCIVGDVICVQPNSQVLKQSLLNMLYSEIGGVPEWLLIDNGKDYTAETMTGRKRSERVSFDSETKGFYRSIGIQDDMRSLPYQPWSKAQIERFFGTLISKFEKWFASYTGTLTGKKTSAKVKKDIQKMLEQDELISFEEFCELWREWRDEYHHSFHRGLKDQGEKWHTPIEVFRNAEERYIKAPPPKSYATILMMKAERVLVRNIGIKKFGYEYRADELCHYIGEKVDIKWDPNDVTKLYVYTTDGEKICEAYSQELLLIAPKVPQKALEEHLKMQKRQLRRTLDELAYYTTPLEERDPSFEGYGNDVAGFIFKNEKPQNTGTSKVIALPDDQQFKEELRSRKAAKAASNDVDHFYQKKAEKTLAALRKLS